MATSAGESSTAEVLDEETLRTKHKAERKALQAQITQLKHQVPKGDKKRKKEAAERAAILEREMDERHERELQDCVKEVTCEMERLQVNGSGESSKDPEEATSQPEVAASHSEALKKPTKAQKRRDKAAAAEREREQRIAEQARQNLMGPRHLEQQAILKQLAGRNLRLHEVPADGNCLYAALSHQLELRGEKKSVCELRLLIGDELESHADDYQPFMTDQNGDALSEDAFKHYCRELRNTNAWGGHVEIQAASRCLQQAIEVIQAEGESALLGESASTLLITYHRHRFGLGEHYNSAVPVEADSQLEQTDSGP